MVEIWDGVRLGLRVLLVRLLAVAAFAPALMDPANCSAVNVLPEASPEIACRLLVICNAILRR